MITLTWGDVVLNSFQNLWVGVISFLPNLIVALVIFILGWIIGALLGRVVAQVLRSLKIDEALAKTGVKHVFDKAGLEINSGGFFGGLVKWFVIVAFLVASFEVIGLTQVTRFLQDVVLSYLPQVIIAALILVVPAVVGEIARKIVSASAKTAGISTANLIGSISTWAVWIFGVSAALIQLGIAESLINTLFMGLVVALSLGLGLSFGLGGQAAAGRFIEEIRQDISDK